MVRDGRRLRAYGIVAAVFVLGAAAGGAASYAIVQQRHAAMFAEGHFEGHRSRALARRLDLDEAQEEKVRAILAKDREDARAAMEACSGPLREHRAKVDAEIRAVLRPDQQAKFDAILAERRDHDRHGPP